MGARGPQPLPSAIKKARGTYRADRAAPGEARATGKPSCPPWVTDKDARKEFARVVKLLDELGTIGAVDGNILTRYVITWVRWRRSVKLLMDNQAAEIMVVGRDEKGIPKQLQVSALHSVVRNLGEELHRMEQSLGMNPSARSRISGTDRGDKSPGFDMPEP